MLFKSEKWWFINGFLTKKLLLFCGVTAGNVNDRYGSGGSNMMIEKWAPFSFSHPSGAYKGRFSFAQWDWANGYLQNL